MPRQARCTAFFSMVLLFSIIAISTLEVKKTVAGAEVDGKLLYTKATYENGAADIEIYSTAIQDDYDGGIINAPRFTHNDFAESSPVWSPDGSKIIFSSSKDSADDEKFRQSLYIMDAKDETSIMRLTAGSKISDEFPAWSPDGTKIAFSRITMLSQERNTIKIAILDIDTGTITELTGSGLYDSRPSWSPDGKKIAFTASEITWPGSHLYVMNADGENASRISPDATDEMYSYYSPSWSYNGQQIAFITTGGIAVSSPDGEDFRLLNGTSTTNGIAWMPDGKKIFFSQYNRYGTDTYDLYSINPDGTELTALVVTEAASESAPVFFTPTNSGVVVDDEALKSISESAEQTAAEIARSPVKFVDPTPGKMGIRSVVYVGQSEPEDKIWLINTDGTGKRKLLDDGYYDYHPDWSPDGDKIAFTSRREPGSPHASHIYTIRPDGTEIQSITSDPAYSDEEPAWSPDGTRIAFTRSLANGNGTAYAKICVINADGTDLRIIPGSGGVDRHPTWSPDGGKIAFFGSGLDPGAGYEIYVTNADGTEVVQLTFPSEGSFGGNMSPAWAPTGDKIAFISREGLAVMNAADGSDQKVIRKSDWLYDPFWSPDGLYLFVVGPMRNYATESDIRDFGFIIMNPDGTDARTFLNDGDFNIVDADISSISMGMLAGNDLETVPDSGLPHEDDPNDTEESAAPPADNVTPDGGDHLTICGDAICASELPRFGQVFEPSTTISIVAGIEVNHELTVKILHPSSKVIFSKTIMSDSLGYARTTYTIPSNVEDGYYYLTLVAEGSNGKSYMIETFQVGNPDIPNNDEQGSGADIPFLIGYAMTSQDGQERNRYENGIPIDITFMLSNPYTKVPAGVPVSITILDSSNNFVSNSVIYTHEDERYPDNPVSASYVFTPQEVGDYAVLANATHGGISSTDYRFGFKVRSSPQYTFEVEGKSATVTVDERADFKQIKSVELHTEEKMVSIAIEPEDWYNVLEVKVPYALLGDPYIVQTEGEVVDIGGTYQSGSITKQSDYAVIRIPVDDSVSKIDIIGTSVIPEFGSIAVVIMAAGIVGVMAISRHREGRRKG